MTCLGGKKCRQPEGHEGICRNGSDRPLILQADGSIKPYSRVTTFAKATDDQSSLMVWKQWTTTVGLLSDPRLFAEADALAKKDMADPAVKRDRNALMERAMIAGGGSRKADRGTLIHAFSEAIDRGEPLGEIPADAEPDLMAYEFATEGLEHLVIEEFTVCDELEVAGTPDRVSFVPYADPDGVVGNKIVDLKTGSLSFAHAMCIQLAIYSRSKKYDTTTGERSDLPPVSHDWGVIIHAPAGTGTASLHWINLAAGWEAVDLTSRVKGWRSTKGLTLPISA